MIAVVLVGGEGTRFGITARNLGIWYPYAEIDPIIQMVVTAVTAEILRLPPPAPIKWQDPSLRVSQKSQTASQQQQAFTAPAHSVTTVRVR